jgi:DNA damage-inducible protein 1
MAPISVTVATPDGQASLLSVEPTAQVSSIAHALHDALAIPPAEQSLSFNGAPLPPDQTFHAACVADGDLILVERVPIVGVDADARSRTPARAGAMETRAGAHTGSTLVEGLRADPAILAQLRTANPPLYDAVNAGNEELVHDLMGDMQELQRRQQLQQQASASHSSGQPPRTDAGSGGDHLDPMSAEAQEHIAERIRMENVIRNLEDAFEHNPESFAQVVMLFVDVKLNGHPTTAFVDSGAQATIISKACAERCGILRLLDTRFSGVARGVGTATIFGRIHLALLDVAGQFFEVSLT